jgi:hypothetical protein
MKLPFSDSKTIDAKIPKLIDVNPDLAPLLEKRDELSVELRTLRTEHFEALELLRGQSQNPYATTAGRTKHDVERAERIAKLLGEPCAEDSATLDDCRREIERRIGDLNDALGLLAERIDAEKRRAAVLVIASIKDRHRDYVANLCGHIVQMHFAHRKLLSLFDELDAGDISRSALNSSIPDFMNGDLPPPARYVRDNLRSGFLKSADVPAEWH